MKKIRVSCELTYLAANVILSLAVAMMTAADFGISMIAAPAYMLHLFSQGWSAFSLTFGQAEYVVQGLLFVLFCVLMRRFNPLYLVSFGTGLLYGGILDLWRLIPCFATGAALSVPVRIVFFAIGELITALAIALIFKTYIYAQIYDFFVKGVVEKYRLPQTKFKVAYDVAFLLIALIMSWTMFGTLLGHGIGIGTLIITAVNGVLIGGAGKLLDRFFVFEPTFPKIAAKFT